MSRIDAAAGQEVVHGAGVAGPPAIGFVGGVQDDRHLALLGAPPQRLGRGAGPLGEIHVLRAREDQHIRRLDLRIADLADHQSRLGGFAKRRSPVPDGRYAQRRRERAGCGACRGRIEAGPRRRQRAVADGGMSVWSGEGEVEGVRSRPDPGLGAAGGRDRRFRTRRGALAPEPVELLVGGPEFAAEDVAFALCPGKLHARLIEFGREGRQPLLQLVDPPLVAHGAGVRGPSSSIRSASTVSLNRRGSSVRPQQALKVTISERAAEVLAICASSMAHRRRTSS